MGSVTRKDEHMDFLKVMIVSESEEYKQWKREYDKALADVLQSKKATKELESGKPLSQESWKFLKDCAMEMACTDMAYCADKYE